MLRSRRRVLSCCLMLLVSFVLVAPSFAANDRPVKMSEVSRLVEDQSPQDVLAVLVERGVAFRMSPASEKRLAKFGFTEEQIAIVKRIAAGEDVDLSAPAEEPAEEGAAGPEEAAPADGELKVGFPDPDHWHNAEQNRIERAIKNAGLPYKRNELTRVTLYCSDDRARELLPLMKRLEDNLIKRFPAVVSSASSPKSAHIVFVDGTSEWSNWVGALMDSYEKDGITFSFGPGGDSKDYLEKQNGFFLPALATANTAGRTKENISRFATYAQGHLMMARAGGEEQPDGLTTGFGDLAEATAMGTPSVMIYSYEQRDLTQDGGWKEVVKKRIEGKEVTNATAPWGYSTDRMKPEHYAECWSMVSAVAEAPDKFAEAVRLVREEGKPMNVAINDLYGMTDKDLLKAWYKWVSK